MKIIFLSLVCSLLFACGGESNKSEFTVDTNHSPGSTEIEFDEKRARHDTLHSSLTGVSYPLHIYLPKHYDTHTEQHYPVIYATDGQWIFEGFGKIIDRKQKNIILVAIEQGPDNRRAIDYRLPGAKVYFDFLIAELLPYIEQLYRVKPEERSLLGTSYGGILAGLAPLMDDIETPVFKQYLSFDPSFYEHQSSTQQLEQARFNASQQLKATLFLSSASLRGNHRYVQWYTSLLNRRQYEGLSILNYSYSVDHNDVANPSFSTVLEQFF